MGDGVGSRPGEERGSRLCHTQIESVLAQGWDRPGIVISMNMGCGRRD